MHSQKGLGSFLSTTVEETSSSQVVGSIFLAVYKHTHTHTHTHSYHFLVYNASVQLWRVCRPFQRPGYYRLFAKALQTIVKALEECKEKDYAWRLELMM